MKLDGKKLADLTLPDAAAWAVVGPEDTLRRQAVQSIAKRFLAEGFGEFDFDRLDGDGLEADAALTAWYTLPLASERRVVVVQSADQAKASSLEKIAKAIPRGSGRGCLVLDVASDSGKSMSAVLKAVGEHGVVVECKAANDQDARAMLAAKAVEMGLKLEPLAAEEMVKRLGPGLSMLTHELDKIASYVYPNTVITRADVQANVPEPHEERIFALIDAICEGRLAQALGLLRDLFAASEDERGAAHRTLAMIARQYRLLWQARLLRDHGFAFRDALSVPASVLPLLPLSPNVVDTIKRQGFLMNKFRSQTQRLTQKDIGSAIEIIAEADMALKGQAVSAGGPVADLEMCVTRLAGLARTSGKPA